MSDDIHEIYAIRYGHHDRKSSENFIGSDPHDVLQPLDFYVWAIVGRSGPIILDTGFDAAMGKKRQREMIKPIDDGAMGQLFRAIRSWRDVAIKILPEAVSHNADRDAEFLAPERTSRSNR